MTEDPASPGESAASEGANAAGGSVPPEGPTSPGEPGSGERRLSGDDLLSGAGIGELASVTATENHPGLIVTISGEVDISNVDSIAESIYSLPNTEDGLLIDLSAVVYLDSSAISLLHDLAMRLRSRAQRMVVVSPPTTPPRRILDLTALSVNAPVTDELESGISLLTGGIAPP